MQAGPRPHGGFVNGTPSRWSLKTEYREGNAPPQDERGKRESPGPRLILCGRGAIKKRIILGQEAAGMRRRTGRRGNEDCAKGKRGSRRRNRVHTESPRTLERWPGPRQRGTGKRSSEQEQRVDALAPGAEEGRRKLRKAAGRRYSLRAAGVRMGKPDRGEPLSSRAQYISTGGETPRTETSK